MTGTVRHIKIPGVAPLVRNAEQLDADVAGGRQWRTDIVAFCGNGQDHGIFLNGQLQPGDWLWTDATGERWLARYAGFGPQPSADGSTGMGFELVFDRYGVIGGSPVQRRVLIQLTAAQCGQESPVLEEFVGRNIRVVVLDATRSGDKAMLGVVAECGPETWFGGSVKPTRIIGIVEVQMSGTPMTAAPMVTWSIIATRAQACGNAQVTLSAEAGALNEWVMDITREEDPDPGTPLQWTDTIHGWKIDPSASFPYIAGDLSQTSSGGASGAIVGASYTDSGSISMITVDWSYSWSKTYSMTSSGSGTYEYYYQQPLVGSGHAELTGTVTESIDHSWTLKRDGVVIDSVALTVSSEKIARTVWDLDVNIGMVETVRETSLNTSETSPIGTHSSSTTSQNVFDWVHHLTNIALYVTMHPYLNLYDHRAHAVVVWPYCQRSAGFVVSDGVNTIYRQVQYPGGVLPLTQEAYSGTPRLYGSFNPSTGEYTVGRTWRAWV
jgi:hypothetical protein